MTIVHLKNSRIQTIKKISLNNLSRNKSQNTNNIWNNKVNNYKANVLEWRN